MGRETEKWLLVSLEIGLGSCWEREVFFWLRFGKRGRPGNGIVACCEYGVLVR